MFEDPESFVDVQWRMRSGGKAVNLSYHEIVGVRDVDRREQLLEDWESIRQKTAEAFAKQKAGPRRSPSPRTNASLTTQSEASRAGHTFSSLSPSARTASVRSTTSIFSPHALRSPKTLAMSLEPQRLAHGNVNGESESTKVNLLSSSHGDLQASSVATLVAAQTATLKEKEHAMQAKISAIQSTLEQQYEAALITANETTAASLRVEYAAALEKRILQERKSVMSETKSPAAVTSLVAAERGSLMSEHSAALEEAERVAEAKLGALRSELETEH
eukprot:SAG11_NODE_4915_length_1723_cov_1.501847_1_plen_274_part_01